MDVRRTVWIKALAASAGAGIAATGIGLAIGSGRTTAAALVYMLAVLAVATLVGMAAGTITSLLAFLGLNYFFTPPRRTLSVSKVDDLVALVVFLSLGVMVSTLVAWGREQRERAERRELEARSLYALSTRMLDGAAPDTIFGEVVRIMCRLFGLARCELYLGEAEEAVAAEGGPAVSDPVAIPLEGRERPLGRLVAYPGEPGLGPAERRMAGIMARQTAALVERVELERRAGQARLDAETNAVRRALLSAVSHDFRTPLASIKAALTGLLATDGSPVAAAATDELLRTALEETERLERLVTNLLDLTRIRSGALAPERVPVAVEDLIDEALGSLRSPLAGRPVPVVVRPDMPELDVDPVQTGQVLRNVLENAVKYSPPGSEIRISATPWRGFVEVRIADRGAGIHPGERDAVFEEFYRASDARAAGTGLGLAVARAIVTAHGGSISIEDTPGGGATVVVRLPAVRRSA